MKRTVVTNRQHLLSLVILTVIGLLGFGLRVHVLDAREIWGDEAFSVVTGAMPLAEIVAPMVDMHPPLYYAVNGAWMVSAGTSVFGMRYGTLLMGWLLVAVAYGFGRDLFGRRTGWLAALLVAVSPVLIYYAQELRMYSLLALSTGISMWFFLRLTQRNRQVTWRDWLIYLSATLVAMYTHYNAFLVIAAQNLIVLVAPAWRGQRLRWYAGQFTLAVIYFPWFLTNADHMWNRFQQGGDTGAGLTVARILDTTWRNLSSWLVSITAGHVAVAVVSVLAGTVAALIAVVRAPREHRYRVLVLVFWGAFMLLAVAFMNSTAGYYHPRFALPGTLAFLLLIAYGLSLLWDALIWQRAIAGVILVVLVSTAAIANHNWYTDPAYAKSGYGASMDYIERNAGPNDYILYNGPYQRGVHFYYAPETIPGTLLDMQRVNQPDNVGDYLAGLAGDADRIWLVEGGDVAFYDPWRLVPKWLTERGFLQRSFSYLGGTVSLYVIEDGTPDFTPAAVQFGESIGLSGYALQPETVQAGDVLRLTLRWEAITAPDASYTVGNYLLDENGVLVSQTDAQPGNGARQTDSWQTGETIIDRFAIPLPETLAPGTYTLAVGLYPYPDLTRLAVTVDGESDGDIARLTTVRVTGDGG